MQHWCLTGVGLGGSVQDVAQRVVIDTRRRNGRRKMLRLAGDMKVVMSPLAN